MKAGFGKEKITPPLGMPMEGLGQEGGCRSVHDELWCRALALEQSGKRLLIVALDVLFFERPVVDRFKAALFREFRIAPDAVLLNTSHTHAGPRVSSWAYSDGPEPRYLDLVEQSILSAAGTALRRMSPVQVQTGAARTDLPVSRRKAGPDGVARWAPCRTAEVCRHVPFCVFRKRNGDVLSVAVSVSCHPSMIYSLDISADYPGVVVRRLNRFFGTDGAIFLQGAGGDTKPRQIAVAEERWRQGTWSDVNAAGNEVAEAVMEAARASLAGTDDEIACSLLTIKWPLEKPPGRRFFEKLASDDAAPLGRKRWAADMLRSLDISGSVPTHADIQVHGVQIGSGLRMIGVEAELVGELGNLILRKYPRGLTFALGYTNGTRIYLPSDRMIPQGGYEVDSYWEYHWPAPLRPCTGRLLASALRRLDLR